MSKSQDKRLAVQKGEKLKECPAIKALCQMTNSEYGQEHIMPLSLQRKCWSCPHHRTPPKPKDTPIVILPEAQEDEGEEVPVKSLKGLAALHAQLAENKEEIATLKHKLLTAHCQRNAEDAEEMNRMEDEIADLRAALAKWVAEAAGKEGKCLNLERKLTVAVNSQCTCGGSGPGESDCVACAIYHAIMTELDTKPQEPEKADPAKTMSQIMFEEDAKKINTNRTWANWCGDHYWMVIQEFRPNFCPQCGKAIP